MDDIRKNEVNLLTLPRSDVGLSMPKDDKGDNHQITTYPSLLLLQLPAKWNAEDLKEARFVVPKQQASLVVEHRETSFQLQRVETSNALVLVPPAQADATSTTATSAGGRTVKEGDPEKEAKQPEAKRRKMTDKKGAPLQLVQARLLHKGSGAFFLEGTPVPVRLADLRALLPVWDPYIDKTTEETAASSKYNTLLDLKAPTLTTLGNALAKSRAEVFIGLRQLQAVSLPGNECYCRLAEEPRLDVLDAVLATLVEAFPHYLDEGLQVADFVASARLRLPRVLQTFDDAAVTALIRNGLSTLMPHDKAISETSRLGLDVERVAAAVASRILTRQPLWEESLLLARWQSEMPGVETQVSTAWLRGHAVRVAQETNEVANPTTYYWKYLPAVDVVETDDSTVVWDRLVQAKPEWTMATLEPYLDAWQLFTGQVPATVLRHAAVRVVADLKIYHARTTK